MFYQGKPSSSYDVNTWSRNSRSNFFHHTSSPFLIISGLSICPVLRECKLMRILASSAHRNESQKEGKKEEGKQICCPQRQLKNIFFYLLFLYYPCYSFFSPLYLAQLNAGLEWYWTDHVWHHRLSLLSGETCIHGKWVCHGKLFAVLISNMTVHLNQTNLED